MEWIISCGCILISSFSTEFVRWEIGWTLSPDIVLPIILPTRVQLYRLRYFLPTLFVYRHKLLRLSAFWRVAKILLQLRHKPEFCRKLAEFCLEPEFLANLSFTSNAQKKAWFSILFNFAFPSRYTSQCSVGKAVGS